MGRTSPSLLILFYGSQVSRSKIQEMGVTLKWEGQSHSSRFGPSHIALLSKRDESWASVVVRESGAHSQTKANANSEQRPRRPRSTACSSDGNRGCEATTGRRARATSSHTID